MKVKTYISEELQPIFDKECSCVRHFSLELRVQKYSNAIEMPSRGWGEGLGGVLDNKGDFVPQSAFTQGYEKVYCFLENDVHDRNESVVFLGILSHCWGHALVDNFRHFWFLMNKQTELLNKKIIYVTDNNTHLQDSVIELFRMAGLDLHKAELITQLTRFDEVYIPDSCVINNEHGSLWSLEYKRIIDRIKSNITVTHEILSNPKLKRIYFTRTQLPQSTRDIGEWTIEKIFRDLGYAIIAPEKLSLEKQLQLLLNCDEFAATEGSVAHNAIFTRPHTSVSLILKAPYFNPYQWMINDLAKVDCTYIEAQDSFRILDVSYGPFLMIKSKYLCEYAEIKYKSFTLGNEFSRMCYKYSILAKVRKKCCSHFCSFSNPI